MMIRILFLVVVSLGLAACTDPSQSFLLYRLPYANGTQVDVLEDHTTHSPSNQVDLAGVNGAAPYPVVAAQSGIVRAIEDDNIQNCCGGNCANNYVLLEHLGGEWTKYSHLAENSVRVDAGLSVGDVVVAGTFLGWESNVGRACGTHLHFEVGVPTNPNSPLMPGNAGNFAGTNKIPRFCGVPGQIVMMDDIEVAVPCDTLNCIQSRESPSTEGNCGDGLAGDVCVQEIDNVALTSTYMRGVDFESSSVKIDLDWCPDAECSDDETIGRALYVTFFLDDPSDPNADPITFVANCQNRKVLETVHHVEEIVIEEAPNLSNDNTACLGNTVQHAFARWEICELPPQFADMD